MLSKRFIYIVPTLLFTLIAAVFQGACSYTGKTVEPDRLFELESGESRSGKLETKDLTFKYQYDLKGNNLSLTGDIKFVLRGVRQFRMQIHFVDAQGMILDNVAVPISNLSVRINLQVPPTTRSLAFSYSGETIDRNNESMPVSFWRVP